MTRPSGHHFDTVGFRFALAFFGAVAALVAFAHWGGAAIADPRALRGALSYTRERTAQEALAARASRPTAPEEQAPLRLAFVGDIMLDRAVARRVAEVGGGDWTFPFARAAETLRGYDIAFGNLEGPLSDKGADAGAAISFRMDPAALAGIADAGFDALSLANNHAGDWGTDALLDTRARLAAAGIAPVGAGENAAEARAPTIITRRGTRVALLAFSQFGKNYLEAGENAPGIALIEDEAVAAAVAAAREAADIVVVSFHFGAEYEPNPSAYQRNAAESAVAAGADIVVGHHPHVVQPLERHGDGWIAYSLGNFVFDQPFSKETMRGGLLEVEVKDARVSAVRLKEVALNENFQPEIREPARQ